ncbi:hypothetical protein KMW28_27400 [Flammeovirga yaeyamensis]|uniref:Uncharacterized protein n=1 Tax=Flammeovirga yaeyamensis TaxID=367791 RepID=A0AAX1NF32_9BACT|nr:MULTISPECIES: hypothetical protein [Flammeovirga]ANQ52318.1 hypothetical protein MY04_4983 [Flammeovirga sp. MY04]MBB3699990.1 hypothetical protein [Flammeovirga yaeyamensis]NMF37571.1 hypothetical protein [Flammeovirga yaeyamensis]QWG04628.1 hypothetical protein KMW28_27400 [Flammeovirga yaeyamensis]
MAYLLNQKSNNLHLELLEPYNLTQLCEAFTDAAVMLANKGCEKLVIDTLKLETPFSLIDRCHLISNLSEFGFKRSTPLINVCGSDDDYRRNMETLAKNRGWNLTTIVGTNSSR